MKFAGWYGVIVGLLMLIQWSFFLATGQVPELKTEPIRIYFHLASEFVAALGLLVSGVALLRRKRWAPMSYLIAAGMLLYSVIVSPGYFAQQGQWGLVVMFAIIFFFTLRSIVKVIQVT